VVCRVVCRAKPLHYIDRRRPGVLQVWWVFVAASLASAGDLRFADVTAKIQAEALKNNVSLATLPGANSTFKYLDELKATKFLLIYHFFGLLWTTQFIQVRARAVASVVACGPAAILPVTVSPPRLFHCLCCSGVGALQGISVCTLSGVCAGWYFSLNDGNNPSVQTHVRSCCGRVWISVCCSSESRRRVVCRSLDVLSSGHRCCSARRASPSSPRCGGPSATTSAASPLAPSSWR
jgi:hypothetical protein